jgi:ABC-type Fe3+ transport system substrate-binding protein
VRAVIDGVCDIAIVNSYYAANFIHIDQELREQKHPSIRLVFPNAVGRGTHVTISGSALMKHSRNKDGGIRLIVLLTSEVGQRMLNAVNDKCPVTNAVAPPTCCQTGPHSRPMPCRSTSWQIDELMRKSSSMPSVSKWAAGPKLTAAMTTTDRIPSHLLRCMSR